MYQLILNPITNQPVAVKKQLNADTLISIPFDPANTDYANFKAQINSDEAQLQDAEGNVMADAKDYVKELP